MAKLTEEQLAKLYPQAKTYDELQEEREKIQELRRPKFVALRIAFWTALCIPATAVTLFFLARVAAGLSSGATTSTLTSICLSLLIIGINIAFIYYMWWLADNVASRVILTSSVLYGLLAGVLIVATAAYFYAVEREVDALLAATIATGFTFVLSAGIVGFLLKQQ